MEEKIRLSIINRSANLLPEYKTAGSAGMDLQAFLHTDLNLKPGERIIVPTGLYLEIPKGYEVQVRPRSGLALEHGITCLNSPGTVDSDYRGEIKVILINLGQKDFIINNGTRIAQMILAKVEHACLVETDVIGETSRGEGGFGHTGKN